jgi:ubiquinol-cytochrome c reductase cytochrome b subunit
MASRWLPWGEEALGSFLRRAAERFGLIRIRETVLRRRVPKTPWYHGDGAALTMLFLVQIATGVTLTLYYTNSADHAYESVLFITHELTMGWLIRAIHYWTAGIMVVVLVLHLFRHLVLGGYKAPREGTWIIGVFLFFLVLAMSFTGYVLRWDERGVYAARVVLNMVYKVPLIGEPLVLLVQGAPELGSITLTRMFSVHVWMVPLLLIALVGYHLYLVIIHGVTAPVEHEQPIETAEEQKEVYKEAAYSEERGEWFHPHTMFLTGRMAFLIFSIAFIVALIAGAPELYPEGNLVARSFPVEEWWFWWYSSLIALLPPSIAPIFLVGFPVLLFLGMLLLPFLDRGPDRGARNRPLWVVFVLLCVIGLLWLTDLRTRSPWTGWPDSRLPPTPHHVTLGEEAERGRLLYVQYGCNSCHAVSSRGRQVGTDLARMAHRYSPSELRSYILDPPTGVAMPSYRGRISEADLERVVEFVLVAQTFPREH